MVQKKRKAKPIRRVKNTKRDNDFGIEKEILKIEKEMDKDIRRIEGYIRERRRFFIKLAIVCGLIGILLILSHLFFRVNGFG